jgi:hypothetical protein
MAKRRFIVTPKPKATKADRRIGYLQLQLNELAERIEVLEGKPKPPRRRYGCPRRPVLGRRPTGRR